jgi:hypothetical protein
LQPCLKWISGSCCHYGTMAKTMDLKADGILQWQQIIDSKKNV